MYPVARRIALRSHCSPKTSSSPPTTMRSASNGSEAIAGPSATVTSASETSAAATPISVERQPRVVPTASTMVRASTISTALARKAERNKKASLATSVASPRSPRRQYRLPVSAMPHELWRSCGRIGRAAFRLGARVRAIHAGDMPSQLLPRDRVVVNHLPLARALAVRYRGRGEPLDDLVQVASLALVKAANRWEPDRGLTFATYAVPTILGELRRYFRAHTWDVRPPRRLQELTRVVARAREELVGAPLDTRAREALRLRFEDDLHQHEIAARLGVSQVSVSRL